MNWKGVSYRCPGFSTGTWDWNVGLDYLAGTGTAWTTGMWDGTMSTKKIRLQQSTKHARD